MAVKRKRGASKMEHGDKHRGPPTSHLQEHRHQEEGSRERGEKARETDRQKNEGWGKEGGRHKDWNKRTPARGALVTTGEENRQMEMEIATPCNFVWMQVEKCRTCCHTSSAV